MHVDANASMHDFMGNIFKHNTKVLIHEAPYSHHAVEWLVAGEHELSCLQLLVEIFVFYSEVYWAAFMSQDFL